MSNFGPPYSNRNTTSGNHGLSSSSGCHLLASLSPLLLRAIRALTALGAGFRAKQQRTNLTAGWAILPVGPDWKEGNMDASSWPRFGTSRAAIALTVLAMFIGGIGALGAPPASASHFCGKFHESGLLTTVQVYANRYIGCDRATQVMKSRFNGHTPAGWHCVGPQTGYALCTKARKRVSAHF
jgi:hypothetical protein